MRTIMVVGLAMMVLAASAQNRRRKRPTRGPQMAGGWMDLYKPHTHNGMPYRLMSPKDFNTSRKYPVIISLHGAGGKGTDNRKQLKGWNKQLAEEKVRSEYPCYIVAPQAKGLWSGQDFQNIKEVIKDLPAVDMDRIYILGHSMGGHGTYIMIQIEPGYFAAAAPSAGSGLKSTEHFIDPAKIKDLPIWAFHGTNDKVCPYEKDKALFAAIKRLGGNMKLTSWKGDGHAVSDKFISGADNGTTEMSSDRCDPETDFLKWLFKQKRGERQ